jgi:protein TonB
MQIKNIFIGALLLSAPIWAANTNPGLGPDDRGPIHVAQEIQDLRLIDKVKPVYPELAKLSRTEGAVTLQVAISKEGSVTKVDVVNGPALLTRAAQEAVKQWKYKPTVVNGQAVDVVTTVRIVFSINVK